MAINIFDNSSPCNGKNSNVARPTAVAGSFYPSDKKSLLAMVQGFYSHIQSTGSDNVQAVIVPHAGYVFSGAMAAKAFASIAPSQRYKRIFLIGPSHCTAFDGASVNTSFPAYSTPLGAVPIDTTVCSELIRSDSVFTCLPEAHNREHCLEVQLPLLQAHLQEMPPIVPIIIGTDDMARISRITDSLIPYFTPDNLFVISSDFSHYPAYTDACRADKRTGDAIATGDVRKFISAINENTHQHITNLLTSACGQAPIAILLMLSQGSSDIVINHLGYCNSGDSQVGRKSEVVGYHAFTFTHSSTGDSITANDFSLSETEKATLLQIAREAISNKLNHTAAPPCSPSSITDTLQMHCGAFVTLRIDGELRGCIGNLTSDSPLYQVVKRMARSAAFSDPRFYPLSAAELSRVKIEVSVLSPLKKIHSINEIIMGRHGVYIVKGNNSGTFLPQVAAETNWTKEEFLGHCARDKAGIGWDGWRDADIYIYEAEAFEEK